MQCAPMAKPLLIIKRRLRHIPLSGSVTRLLTHTIVWKCHDCFWHIAPFGELELLERSRHLTDRARSLAFADIMGEVERMANDPLPVAHRAPRIAALERESCTAWRRCSSLP